MKIIIKLFETLKTTKPIPKINTHYWLFSYDFLFDLIKESYKNDTAGYDPITKSVFGIPYFIDDDLEEDFRLVKK